MQPRLNKYLFSLVLSLFGLGLWSTMAMAQLALPQIFSNGMVLQRNEPIPIWGQAGAGDSVTVTLLGQSKTVISDDQGSWSLELPAMKAGGPYFMTIESGNQSINISDFYIGDVWIASGQSNMELQVSGADSANLVINNANDPKLRQFKVRKGLSDDPSEELPGGSEWTPATSTYVGNFTAVGYFFAQKLREHLDIPIGILNVSYGGSRIETWMSEEMLGFDEQDVVLANGEAERQPTVAYNKMLHPLIPYNFKGVIWYQGESNADNMEDAKAYGELFKKQIRGWRALWDKGDFPFLWVQLPNYGQVYDQPQTWDAWPQLRAGQSSALSLPNTGEAVTIDVGGTSIHPTHKQPVGRRLALAARHVAYGEDLVYSGPRYASNRLQDDRSVVINFNHVGSGLIATGSTDGTVHSIAITGEDGKLVWADAVISNNQLIVSSDQVPKPVEIRYAWEYNPADANLYNGEGLPAAPFLITVNPGFKITKFEAVRTAIEQGQSTTLSWQVFGSSSVTLDGVEVDTAGTKTITPTSTTTYTLIAHNRDPSAEIQTDTTRVTVEVLDPNQINRALGQPTTASTFESIDTTRTAELATDGKMSTRWSSAWSDGSTGAAVDPNLDDNPDDEWLAVDLGEAIDIERLILNWEAAYGSSYNIEASYDGYIWHSVYEERQGDGDEDNITFDTPVSARFIRMHGLDRATQYGYSIYEMAVYGTLSEQKPPVVSLSSSKGNVLTPDTEVKLSANATDEDGSVSKVDFYVDGTLLTSVDQSPFETTWTPDGSQGEYTITAIATDNDDHIVQSDPFTIYMDDGTLTHFEAEQAQYTGTVNVRNAAAASGGKFLDLQDGWSLTFNNIGVPENGEYLLSIGYQLTYESPKSQYLVVNGDTVETVEFIAPSTSAWLQKGIKVSLKAGKNTIAINGFWNWMGIDYIAVSNAEVVSIENSRERPHKFELQQNYPNPFNPTTNIRFSLAQSSQVSLTVYNRIGQRVRTLLSGKHFSAGQHEVHFDASLLPSGLYFYKMQAAEFSQTRKMMLLK